MKSAPQKFEKYLKKLFHKIEMSNKMNVVFLTAWNEWGEGSYLEPDAISNYSWLEALEKAING